MSATHIAELMHKHRNELLRFLSQRVSCNEIAMDLFQDTFIRYAGYKGKAKIENPKAFIFKIAANLATDYLRAQTRRCKHVIDHAEELEEIEASQPSLEQNAITEQQLEQLVEALSELPPKCSRVFILLKLKHYSYAEVERELGISQTMILKYLNRALNHCKARLEEIV